SAQRHEQIHHRERARRQPFLSPFQAVNVKAHNAPMKLVFGIMIAINCARPAAMSQGPALLTAFTNPVPSKDDLFGRSVAALGSDRVIVGASGRTSAYTNEAIYLFTTNGQLLTTFTNPIPADNIFYGEAVAAVGTDRVLVGAYQSGFASGM